MTNPQPEPAPGASIASVEAPKYDPTMDNPPPELIKAGTFLHIEMEKLGYSRWELGFVADRALVVGLRAQLADAQKERDQAISRVTAMEKSCENMRTVLRHVMRDMNDKESMDHIEYRAVMIERIDLALLG